MTGFFRFLLLFTAFGNETIVQAQQKPNIIFILADDLGYASIGAFGQQKIKTPNLDRLAAEGIKLTDFYSNSICAPSRASFITGMHSGHCIIRDNLELGGFEDSTEFGQMPLTANMTTLGTVLQSAGYKTAAFGKWGLGGPNSSGVPWKQGFDFFYGYLDQKQAHNYYPTHLWKNETSIPFEGSVKSAHQQLGNKPADDPASFNQFKGKFYSGDTITGEAIKFIHDNKSRPFFMYMAYTLPHMALQVPDKYLNPYLGKFEETPLTKGGYLPHQYPRSAYAAMISLLDDYIGRIVEQLKLLKLDKNTLVIFTADNGAATGGGADPDYFDCSGVLKGRKGTLYEGGIREPFLAWWPGKIKPVTQSAHITAIWDMLPTFAELAGARLPVGMDGISIVPVLLGKNQIAAHTFLYWETHSALRGMQAVRFGKWKAVRKGTHLNREAPIELYNLHDDIAEKNEISGQHPDIVLKAKTYMNTRKLAVIPEWNFFKLRTNEN